MKKLQANSSVVAILVILLVIAGILYLFWQQTQPVRDASTTDVEPAITEEAPDGATEDATEGATSLEVPAPDLSDVEEMMVIDESKVEEVSE